MAPSAEHHLVAQVQQIWQFLRSLKITPWYFIEALFFSVTAAAFETLSLTLLIPLIQGVTTFDYSFLRQSRFFLSALNYWPAAQHFTNQNLFVLLLLLVTAAALLKNVLRYLSGVSVAKIARVASHRVRRALFHLYMTAGKPFYDQHNIGYLNQLLIDYTERVTRPLSESHQILNAILSCAAYVGVLLYISWRLTLIVLIIFPLMVFVQRHMVQRIRGQSRVLADSIAAFSKTTFNTLSAIPLVWAYTTQAEEVTSFSAHSNKVANTEYKMQRLQHLIRPFQETITLVAILVLVLAIAWVGPNNQHFLGASFLVYFYVLLNAATSFAALQRMQGLIAQASGPLTDIEHMLATGQRYEVADGHQEFRGLQKNIEFRHVTFAYPDGRAVLQDFSCIIPRGQLTAIVGPSGAGKSTIIQLLMQYYASSPDTLLVDGTDIRNFTRQSLRAHLALVSQDTILFNDTVRRNLAYGLNGVTDQQLREVCDKARLTELLERLPQGLETFIGDRGVKLSGGERQRIAIARALLKGAEILLLDEATSALDSTTEHLIQAAIDEAIKDKTAIVVAHRLSTIKHADTILVLDNGRLVEQGALADLLAQQGVFFKYWEAQKFF